MFRFYLRQLVRSFFPRSRRRSRLTPHKRVHSYRPHLEGLEDRTVPAIQLTYGGTGTPLTLSDLTGTQDNVTISEQAGNMLQLDLNGAMFDPGSSTTNVTYRGVAATKVGWKTAFSFRMM